MRQNLDFVQSAIGLSEGGFVNNSKDPGGATDRGITQATFDGFNKSKGLPTKPVKGISKALAEQIIYENYLLPIRFDDLPSGLDYTMADYAVNSGVSRPVRTLQALLGVKVDGVLGAITLAKVKDVAAEPGGLADLIVAINEERIAFMKRARHPKTKALLWPEFGKGWQRRVMGKLDGPQPGRDIGVIDRSLHMINGIQPSSMPQYQEAAKAPDPDTPTGIVDDPISVSTLVSGGGAASAFAAILSPLGGLHPVVQGIVVVGLVVALGAVAYTLLQRRQRARAGLI